MDKMIVFQSDESFYCKDALLIIDSCVIMKNNYDDCIFAYTSFRNLSNKTIKGLKISLDVKDVFGSSLGVISNLQYLDLNVKRNDAFGEDLPVQLSDRNIRSYRVIINSVIYEDNSTINIELESYEPVPKLVNIEQILSPELIEQYNKDTNYVSKYESVAFSNLWICSCGCFNTNDEEICFSCHKDVEFYKEALDVDRLQTEKENFDRAENEKRAQIEHEKAIKKKKLLVCIIATISVLFIIATVIVAVKLSSNKKVAAEIYDNFLGKSFSDVITDDDNFYNDYLGNNLNNYKTYWETKESFKLSFHNDGSVSYYKTWSMTALAWPSILGSQPEGSNLNYDGDYDSFSVKVSLSGQVYLVLGSSKYKVYVDENCPSYIHYDDYVLN